MGYENEFFKEQRRRFANVYSPPVDTKESQQDRIDGYVVESIAGLLKEGNKPVTEAKIRKRISGGLSKRSLARLKRSGGLRASLKRMEDLGILYKDKEWGWKID